MTAALANFLSNVLIKGGRGSLVEGIGVRHQNACNSKPDKSFRFFL